jgi:RimJ/RimL family protein N-acetyltransferase
VASSTEIVAETERLLIRPWRLEEADRLFDLPGRIEVVRWLGRPARSMVQLDEAVSRIERWATELAADPRFGAWAAVERSSGVRAGTVLLKPLPDGVGEVEIGWHFRPDSFGVRDWRASRALPYWHAASRVDLRRVWAVTDLGNHVSVAVCRRIGMRLLGVTHRWYHDASLMFWVGAREDQVPSLGPDVPLSDIVDVAKR